MNSISKVISTKLDSLNRRLIKVLRFGRSDVQEVLEASPHGIDSNPVKGMVAIYSKTSENGKNVVIGYVNKNKIANVGEFRAFSTDENNNVKAYIYLKNDGDLLLNGNSDNAVRYSELANAFNDLQNKYNDLANKWNAFVSAYVPGSPTTIGTPPTLAFN